MTPTEKKMEKEKDDTALRTQIAATMFAAILETSSSGQSQ